MVVAPAAHVGGAPAEPGGNVAAVPAATQQAGWQHLRNHTLAVCFTWMPFWLLHEVCHSSDSNNVKNPQSVPFCKDTMCSGCERNTPLCLSRKSHCRAMGLLLTCISTPHTCCHARGSCCQLPVQSSCRTPAQWHQKHLQTPPGQQNHLLCTMGLWRMDTTCPAANLPLTCCSQPHGVCLTSAEPLKAIQGVMLRMLVPTLTGK